EGGYEVDKQAIAVFNCLKVLDDKYNELIEEKPRKSDPRIVNYIQNKLFPKLKDKLQPYWDCF
ncbi:MAG: hypothetical protein ACTSO4_10430, partial [Promethearchaeota archaeon]